MTAVKIKKHQFTGLSKVYSRDPDGLAAILRGMAIDNARLKVEVASVHDFTDNTTGAAGSAIVALPIGATGPIDATTAGGSSASALNTSLGKIANAGKVISNTINEASALLGLPASSAANGTQAAADTIPAQDKTSTAANGATAADFPSTVTAMRVAAGNLNELIYGANAVLVALGANKLNTAGPFGTPGGLALVALPTVNAVAAGPGAVAKADVDAFLTAYANNLATLAAAWNAAMNQGSPGAGPLHVVAG